ncbi:MAG: F0F1 ATP synthase subunit B [Acidobacteria bacterium]|nr:F0F1 ATP synthase subunit B [Acidobacteriota bacterium]
MSPRLALTIAAAAAAAATALLAAPAAFAAAAAAENPEAANNVFAGDIGNALWTVIIFVLVLLVLGKFAWGPLLAGLQAREAYIRESLQTARRDREEAEARLNEYQEKLAAARTEATAIIEEGRRDAEAVKRRIEEQAKHESDKMIERARREIDAATTEATRQLYSLSAHLATELAGRIIGRELDPKDHERLIAESIAEISARHN